MHNLNYTGDGLDKRLSQGYYDDIVAAGIKAGLWTVQNPPTKEELDTRLFATSVKSADEFVSLLKKNIDNQTIQFDEQNQYIKSQEQTQADWNEVDTSSKAYIKNKPNIVDGAVMTSEGNISFTSAGKEIFNLDFLTPAVLERIKTYMGGALFLLLIILYRHPS